MTLRAIYAEAKREFRESEKTNYVTGFCCGLEKNFKEQREQSKSFALALVTPKAVDDFIAAIPGLEAQPIKADVSRNREAGLLQQTGYVDGKTFQNAGDAARLEN